MTKFLEILDIPTFPTTITVEKASVTLFADGTWKGDRDAFFKAVEESKGGNFVGPTGLYLWIIVNLLKNENRRQE
jgi:hypothetical protein